MYASESSGDRQHEHGPGDSRAKVATGGETLIGQSFATVHGGKGANQAVAAARLGAQVSMVGCVGSDAYGEELRGALLAEQIDCQAVSRLMARAAWR